MMHWLDSLLRLHHCICDAPPPPDVGVVVVVAAAVVLAGCLLLQVHELAAHVSKQPPHVNDAQLLQAAAGDVCCLQLVRAVDALQDAIDAKGNICSNRHIFKGEVLREWTPP